jgi:hypothetical protein
MRASRARLAAGALTAVAVLSVGVGLYLAGSPAEARQRRLDERRVDDLDQIARATDVFWTRHGRVPATLDELRREPGTSVASADPETREAYELRAAGGAAFDVCARFARATGTTSTGDFWSHGAGRQCFRRDARTLR